MSSEKGGSATGLSQLFTELSRNEQMGDFEKALKVANKILQEDSSNLKALHCKIVCLIQMGSFKEAFNEIDKADKNLSALLTFEKAYCQYRLNKVNDAFQTIESIKDQDFHVKELKAQTLYRLERYQECNDLYLELIKNSQDEYEDERETNLAAVIASLSINQDYSLKNSPELGEQTYELCYNKACILLGQKLHKEALEKLNSAEDQCKKALEEDGATEEEIDSELGIIRAQLGYCYQLQKKDETAMRLYNQILKQKPTDAALLTVVGNNIVTINKDQNVFDSKKKMKTALSELNESKLSQTQKRSILFNNCLLLMHTNQGDACRKQLTSFKSTFPEALADAVLIEAALLCKEKKITEAQQLFEEPKLKNSIEISLTNTQLSLEQNNPEKACQILRSLSEEDSLRPGILSTLVILYLSLDNKSAATSLLSKAVKWYEKKKASNSTLYTLYRENAKLLMDSGKPKEAVELLEQLRKANPNNPKVLSLLIKAYSVFDPKKAQEISKNLPSIESIISSVDIDTLETSNWSLGAKYVKKTTKLDTPGGPEKKDKKKKKKRKMKLPKNYDANVDPDPERWLPRYQRSTFKKKKDKRGLGGVGKGTQGSVNEVELKPTKTAATSSPQQGPRQQRPTQKKKKKGGKR